MKIIFDPNPFTADTTGALIGTAIVKSDDETEVYFTEPIRIEASEFTDAASLQAAVANHVAGFQGRVDAILKAKEMAKVEVII
jgi:hypothetical protein